MEIGAYYLSKKQLLVPKLIREYSDLSFLKERNLNELIDIIDNIELTFTDEALEYIADRTIDNKLGARGLRGTIENVMGKAMFELPSSDIKELIIDLDYVKKQID